MSDFIARLEILKRMDIWARCCIPVGLVLLSILMGILPWRLPDVSVMGPSWVLIAVYYWSAQRPDLLPLSLIFLLGLFQDILTGGPLGVSAFLLLSLRGLLGAQRRFVIGQTFFVEWGVFAAIAITATLLEWLCISIMSKSFLLIAPALIQYIVTVIIYPAIAWIFTLCLRALPPERIWL